MKYFLLKAEAGRAGTGSELDIVQWASLLESTGALQMYRRSFGRIQPVNVVDFLVLSRDFPRSLRFCTQRSLESLRAISGNTGTVPANQAERRAEEVLRELEATRVVDLLERGLHEFVDRYQTRLNEIGGAVSETFFQLTGFAAAS